MNDFVKIVFEISLKVTIGAVSNYTIFHIQFCECAEKHCMREAGRFNALQFAFSA